MGVRANLSKTLVRWGLIPALVVGLGLGGVSCTTTYDYEGRPVQSVDPGAVVAGAAAAGVLGYAIGANNPRHKYRHGRGYYPAPRPRPYPGYRPY